MANLKFRFERKYPSVCYHFVRKTAIKRTTKHVYSNGMAFKNFCFYIALPQNAIIAKPCGNDKFAPMINVAFLDVKIAITRFKQIP